MNFIFLTSFKKIAFKGLISEFSSVFIQTRLKSARLFPGLYVGFIHEKLKLRRGSFSAGSSIKRCTAAAHVDTLHVLVYVVA